MAFDSRVERNIKRSTEQLGTAICPIVFQDQLGLRN